MANDPGIVGVLYTLRFSYNNQKKEESQTGRPYNGFWNLATHNQRISLVGNMLFLFRFTDIRIYKMGMSLRSSNENENQEEEKNGKEAVVL